MDLIPYYRDVQPLLVLYILCKPPLHHGCVCTPLPTVSAPPCPACHTTWVPLAVLHSRCPAVLCQCCTVQGPWVPPSHVAVGCLSSAPRGGVRHQKLEKAGGAQKPRQQKMLGAVWCAATRPGAWGLHVNPLGAS